MYSHGIATLAITEAYAMTRDRALRQPAEDAIKFIIEAQYDDGGWRYNPAWENQGPGDMTVTGWQLMALKSALLAGHRRAVRGVDAGQRVHRRRCEQDGGATLPVHRRRARHDGDDGRSGLLCRMIGGWPRETRPLQQGDVAAWATSCPRSNNMYFNYYASQVLHHVGGPRWEKWNPKMREYLVDSQSHRGARDGKLVLRRVAQHAGRPAVHDGDGDHDARGLLPVHAAVQRAVRGSGAVSVRALQESHARRGAKDARKQ